MKAAELRKSILQAAVQGKLVPQDLHDEPSLVLLERIRAEKARLVKEGKIKKETSLPPITEDEVHYDLPEGWIWCRIADVYYTISDKMHNIQQKDVLKEGLYPVVSQSKELVIGYTNDVSKVINVTNPIIVFGDHTRQVKYIDFDFATGADGVKLLIPLVISSKYFYYYLLGLSIEERGYARHYSRIKKIVFPLPPLAEQQRIVAKVDELMAFCDELEAVEQELDVLESRFEEYLPKSILQAAVQGKLVPQDIHDEPASALLEHIRTEKDHLVKEGKIKKEKPLSSITEDEIPYDLPEGWIWCRLGELIQIAENNNIHKNLPENTLINYVDIDAIDNKKYCIKDVKQVPVKSLSSRARRVLQKGFIVYSLVRPYLNNIAVIEDEKENYIGSTGFVVFKPIKIETNYFISFLLSPFVKTYYLSLLSGFNSPSVSQEDFLSTPFPLPPLAEQQRIVAKVNELLALCEEIKVVKTKPIEQKDTNKVIGIPVVKQDEQLQLAARGGISKKPSNELIQAIDDMFVEDE